VERTILGYGGALAREWSDGLTVRITIPMDRLTR
jgi:hypothetical protein